MSDYLVHLNQDQINVLEECLLKDYTNVRGCGLNLPLGFGKSRLSIIISLLMIESRDISIDQNCKILIVCKKPLLANWCAEIEKVFGDSIKYYVYHSEYNKQKITNIEQLDKYQIILTTTDVIAKIYKDEELEDLLITRRIEHREYLQSVVLDYSINPVPLNIKSFIYNTMWSSLIVDEFPLISNIETDRLRGLLLTPSIRRWALSGTFFDEPKPENILSYYLFIQDRFFPNNIPGCKKFITSDEFGGVSSSLVIRDKKADEFEITIKSEMIIFTPEEEKIYKTIRDFILELAQMVKEYHANRDIYNMKKFRGHLMGMLSALRQCIVCPLMPITSIIIDACNFQNRNQLSQQISNKFSNLGINDYLNNEDNIVSSRFKKLLEIAENHKKIIMFSAFRTTIKMLMYIFQKYTNRTVLTLNPKESNKAKKAVWDLCENSDEFILILTYQIGSVGLNMQFADTVVLVDYDWKKTTTTQAISRVARQGQLNNVNIYFLLSNTGIEDAIFKKQIDKDKISTELLTGKIQTKISSIKISEIITILASETLYTKFNTLYLEDMDYEDDEDDDL